MSGNQITLASIFASICAFGAQSAIFCPALSLAQRTKLSEYVRTKYKLPLAFRLDLEELSFIGNSCYRKLRFKSQDPRTAFQVDLSASPDFRFLSRELLDSDVDPVIEEAEKRRALITGLTVGNFPALGPKEAPVTLTLFSDFQCPYCAEMAQLVLKEVLPTQRQRVRLVFRNFPLSMHNWALPAAEAAACAQEQGDKYFWTIHDFLFKQQQQLRPENLRARLAQFGASIPDFSEAEFKACLDQRRMAAKVQQDVNFGLEIGVTGTPTLFVNDHRVSGLRTEEIRTLIREMSKTEYNKTLTMESPGTPGSGQPASATGVCEPGKCVR